jgi:hypothetical protein
MARDDGCTDAGVGGELASWFDIEAAGVSDWPAAAMVSAPESRKAAKIRMGLISAFSDLDCSSKADDYRCVQLLTRVPDEIPFL